MSGKGTLAGVDKPVTADQVSRQMITKEGGKMAHGSNGRNNKRFESQHNPGMHQNAEQAKLSKAVNAKSKKDVRPLSGGIQKLMKHGDRSRITNSQHNMSMFDKIGGSNAAGL